MVFFCILWWIIFLKINYFIWKNNVIPFNYLLIIHMHGGREGKLLPAKQCELDLLKIVILKIFILKQF